jgi:NNP family nitrate/nitrite transporter-like MFS transporter
MEFVSSRHWGKAIAIHEAAPNLSFVLAPLFAEAVLAFFSWDAALTILGFGALVAGGLFAWFGRIGAFAGEAPHFASLRVLFAAPSYWIMVVLFSLGISGSYGIYTMLPLFMVSGHGMERDFANTLLAVSRIPGVIMAFAGGWLSDRIGPKKTLIIVFVLNGLLTVVLGLAPASWLPYLVSIQPMLSVCFFPAGFAALSMAVPSGARHIAVSLTTPVAFIVGGGLVPALIGVFGDAYSFAAGISMVGVLILSGGVISSFLPIGRRPGGS